MDAAVAAARAACEGPRRTFSATHSGRLLSTFAQVVRDHVEEIAWLETRNVDKPISGSRGEARGVANTVESCGGAGNDLHGGRYKLPGMGRELGMHPLDLCTEVKNVFVDLRIVGRGATPGRGLRAGPGPGVARALGRNGREARRGAAPGGGCQWGAAGARRGEPARFTQGEHAASVERRMWNIREARRRVSPRGPREAARPMTDPTAPTPPVSAPAACSG